MCNPVKLGQQIRYHDVHAKFSNGTFSPFTSSFRKLCPIMYFSDSIFNSLGHSINYFIFDGCKESCFHGFFHELHKKCVCLNVCRKPTTVPFCLSQSSENNINLSNAQNIMKSYFVFLDSLSVSERAQEWHSLESSTLANWCSATVCGEILSGHMQPVDCFFVKSFTFYIGRSAITLLKRLENMSVCKFRALIMCVNCCGIFWFPSPT